MSDSFLLTGCQKKVNDICDLLVREIIIHFEIESNNYNKINKLISNNLQSQIVNYIDSIKGLSHNLNKLEIETEINNFIEYINIMIEKKSFNELKNYFLEGNENKNWYKKIIIPTPINKLNKNIMQM